MPVVGVGEDSSSIAAEQIRYRRPRNQPISETDPNPQQIPSIIQSTRCKSTISSLLLSTFTPNNDSTTTGTVPKKKKKNFPSGTFRGLGCAASSQVSVPAVIQTSANWDANKARKKKQRSLLGKKSRDPHQGLATASNHPSSASTSLVIPDVCCGPGIGFTTGAASVDCVVSRRPVSGRVKDFNDDRMKQRERERPSFSTRRMWNTEPMPFLDADHSFGMTHSELDVFGTRYHRHVRHPPPHDDLAEIMMLQSSLLMGGRSDGFDRYRDWRHDIDNMSYEELLELGDRIGYVNTGLKEEEIVHCLRKTKLLDNFFSRFPSEVEWKCSICQEDYEADDEMGKLECGHLYHMNCIKQWLVRKNICPICKTEAAAQQ